VTWPTVLLGEVASFLNGGTPSRARPEFFEGNIPWITGADILVADKFVNTSRSCISDDGIKHSATNLVPAGTVLLVTRTGVGKAAIAGMDLAFSQDITAVLPDPQRVDRDFLLHALRHESPRYKSLAQGATIKGITREVVESTVLPLPPIEEQRRIASILDAADALRTKRRQALAKLNTLTQSIFIDMFGDPCSNDVRYVRRSVGDLALNEDAKRVPVKMSDRALVSGTYPYYGASGVIDYVDDYLFEGQRLLVAEDGANLLARSSPVAFLANGKFWVNNHAHVLADNGEANLTFLRQAIESLDLVPFVTGSAQPKLTRKMLDSVAVPAPPRSAQDEFEARVQALRLVETASTQCLEHLDALFASLQHRAFRGEL
jgi:type I restriction enzyme S subunit